MRNLTIYTLGPSIDKFIRDFYRAGRVEIFHMGRVPRDKFYYLDLTTTFSQLLRDSPSRTTTRGSLGRGTARVSLKIRRAEDERGSAARGGEDEKS